MRKNIEKEIETKKNKTHKLTKTTFKITKKNIKKQTPNFILLLFGFILMVDFEIVWVECVWALLACFAKQTKSKFMKVLKRVYFQNVAWKPFQQIKSNRKQNSEMNDVFVKMKWCWKWHAKRKNNNREKQKSVCFILKNNKQQQTKQ